jgi:hypothetical protein
LFNRAQSPAMVVPGFVPGMVPLVGTGAGFPP